MASVTELKGVVSDFISDNKQVLSVVGAGAAGVVVGSAVGVAAASRSRKKKSTKRRSSARTSRKRSSSRKKKGRSYKYARTAGKGKDRSTRRIRMTKNGQPYIILRSGKARFIKKSSARASRKRKGGRY